MNEKYPNGFFGHIVFVQKKKVKGQTVETFLDIEGVTVYDQDAKMLWLIGTDGIEYLAEKKRISHFEPIVQKSA